MPTESIPPKIPPLPTVGGYSGSDGEEKSGDNMDFKSGGEAAEDIPINTGEGSDGLPNNDSDDPGGGGDDE